MILQNLELTTGERAYCIAGYPKKGRIVIEAKKDFEDAKNSDDIINNPYDYVKVVDGGKFGALTSHWISSNWEQL